MAKKDAMEAKDSAVKKSSSKAKDQKPKNGFFKKAVRFFKDLKSEWKKIVWPSKKTVKNNTLVVLAFTGLAAVSIWILDWLFISLFRLMY